MLILPHYTARFYTNHSKERILKKMSINHRDLFRIQKVYHMKNMYVDLRLHSQDIRGYTLFNPEIKLSIIENKEGNMIVIRSELNLDERIFISIGLCIAAIILLSTVIKAIFQPVSFTYIPLVIFAMNVLLLSDAVCKKRTQEVYSEIYQTFADPRKGEMKPLRRSK